MLLFFCWVKPDEMMKPTRRVTTILGVAAALPSVFTWSGAHETGNIVLRQETFVAQRCTAGSSSWPRLCREDTGGKGQFFPSTRADAHPEEGLQLCGHILPRRAAPGGADHFIPIPAPSPADGGAAIWAVPTTRPHRPGWGGGTCAGTCLRQLGIAGQHLLCPRWKGR